MTTPIKNTSIFGDFIKSFLKKKLNFKEDKIEKSEEFSKTRKYNRVKDYDLNVHLENPENVGIVNCNGVLSIFTDEPTEIILENSILHAVVYAPNGKVSIKGLALKGDSIIIANEVIGHQSSYIEAALTINMDAIMNGQQSLPMVCCNRFVDLGMSVTTSVDVHAREWVAETTYCDTKHPFSDLFRKRINANEITTMLYGAPINGGIMDVVKEQDNEPLSKLLDTMREFSENIVHGKTPTSRHPDKPLTDAASHILPHHEQKPTPKDQENGGEDEGGPAPAPARRSRAGVTAIDPATGKFVRKRTRDQQEQEPSSSIGDELPSSDEDHDKDKDKKPHSHPKKDDKKDDKKGGGDDNDQGDGSPSIKH